MGWVVFGVGGFCFWVWGGSLCLLDFWIDVIQFVVECFVGLLFLMSAGRCLVY